MLNHLSKKHWPDDRIRKYSFNSSKERKSIFEFATKKHLLTAEVHLPKQSIWVMPHQEDIQSELKELHELKLCEDYHYYQREIGRFRQRHEIQVPRMAIMVFSMNHPQIQKLLNLITRNNDDLNNIVKQYLL
jgi:hypothetical protein